MASRRDVTGCGKTVARHCEGFDEFCGDSRLRLSGRVSGRFFPLCRDSMPRYRTYRVGNEAVFGAAVQTRKVALRATDSRRRLSPHNLVISYFASRFWERSLQPRGARGRTNRVCRLRFLRMHVVADVSALHPEDDIFGDVCGVVGDALQIAGDEQRIERLANDVRTLIHRLDQLDESIITHAVDDVVHF